MTTDVDEANSDLAMNRLAAECDLLRMDGLDNEAVLEALTRTLAGQITGVAVNAEHRMVLLGGAVACLCALLPGDEP